MGHLPSRHGIGPAESGVKAIIDQRARNNQAEVRSFLGTVTFCWRHLLDYVTVTEPLRELPCQDSKWKWGYCSGETLRWVEKTTDNCT